VRCGSVCGGESTLLKSMSVPLPQSSAGSPFQVVRDVVAN
jgi:hypothetical protein